MKLSHTIGITASAALLAASGFAAAQTARATYYAPGGVIVASTCGTISPTLAVGNTSTSVAFYPGAGLTNFTLVAPSTSPAASSPGSTVAYTCVAGTYTTTSRTVRGVTTTTAKWTPAAVPAGGLNGATMPFGCFADTQLGGQGDGGRLGTLGHAPVATVDVAFNAAATTDPTAFQTMSVETTETLLVSGAPACSYTTDATWFSR
jgi:hypothetical protein